MKEKNIYINGVEYSLVLEKGPIVIEAQSCLGVFDSENLKIRIDRDLPEARKEQTLIHELLHGLMYEHNINDLLVPEVEEEIVGRLSNALYELIINNDNLLSFFKSPF